MLTFGLGQITSIKLYDPFYEGQLVQCKIVEIHIGGLFDTYSVQEIKPPYKTHNVSHYRRKK